ncbi:YigZ family protein [Colibacter massiliensis]|uniref:YigZ family protein n=1 Tax=Colibacter massiliensis TaxID=1852379 RepID=UPI00266BBCEC|nr:YigZ family protein [Colibacter massiliensis]
MATSIYSSVCGQASGEYTVKKSRFIANVFHVTSEEEAQRHLAEIKKKYWDARHNCYAYQLGMPVSMQKASDDGEPSGTAGKPLLEVLKTGDLTNTLVVVTRYFGGIKLGTGGLIRAYMTAARAAIIAAPVDDYVPCTVLTLQADYSYVAVIEKLAGDFAVPVRDRNFTDSVSFTIEIPLEQADVFKVAFADKTNGTGTVIKTSQEIVPRRRQR